MLERYLAAWHLADIDAFVSVVTEDVRFSMPPFSEWFEGVAAVADFVEGSIFSAARPYGVTLRAGRCNGQPAFAVYEPGPAGSLVAAGLQILTITDQDGRLLVTDVVSIAALTSLGAVGFPTGSASGAVKLRLLVPPTTGARSCPRHEMEPTTPGGRLKSQGTWSYLRSERSGTAGTAHAEFRPVGHGLVVHGMERASNCVMSSPPLSRRS